jgi:hypothetical protein
MRALAPSLRALAPLTNSRAVLMARSRVTTAESLEDYMYRRHWHEGAGILVLAEEMGVTEATMRVWLAFLEGQHVQRVLSA